MVLVHFSAGLLVRFWRGLRKYGGGNTGTYNYISRLASTDVGANVAAVENSGLIQRPLITVTGTMDSLLPIDHHARAYARKVKAALDGAARGRDPHRVAYRLYEVQNGNHIETYKDTLGQLELIQPHAQRSFDLLVDHVERGASLPPSQCIPRGGAISDAPGTQAGPCGGWVVGARERGGPGEKNEGRRPRGAKGDA